METKEKVKNGKKAASREGKGENREERRKEERMGMEEEKNDSEGRANKGRKG